MSTHLINLNKPEAILFDLDGTLLDTAKDLGESLNTVLKSINLPIKPFDEYRPVASHGAIGLLKLGLAEQYDAHNIEALRSQLLESYEKNISVYTQFFDGMSECLAQLKQQSIDWGIVTNKPAFLTDKLLLSFSQMNDSKINISGDTLAVRKPDPTPLLFACEQMQVSPENCWYVGDAQRDIEAGNRAGMFTIVANWGYTQDLTPVEQWGADIILQTPDELSCLLSEVK